MRGNNTYIDGNEVLQRFAHFQTFDVEMPGVDEIVDPCPALVIGLYSMAEIEYGTLL